jgi:FtsZ-binding cell division protein ZapB
MSTLYRAEAAGALQQLEVVRSRLETMLRSAYDHIDALQHEIAHLREENARLLRGAASSPSGQYARVDDKNVG